MVVRRRVIVTGRVQGVFYRDACRNQAALLHVTGWIANRSDGSVEAELEGEESAVGALVMWMREGPPRAVVTNLNVTDVGPPRGDTRFAVR